MREYKYDYTVNPENSSESFRELCEIIARQYPTFRREELFIDDDGSTIQVFSSEGKEIVVYDDYDVGAVFVVSDVDISNNSPDEKHSRGN